MSFDVIFIGKDLVPLTTHYYIFTSRGILKYDVSITEAFFFFSLESKTEIFDMVRNNYIFTVERCIGFYFRY